jgi:MFS family permease
MGRLRISWLEILILLVCLGSRVTALEALPLHNDEGLHLSRAVEVWNLHPFFDIEDGKVAGVWLIALFYPQSAPVFAGRIATVFVGLVGCAAGMALARRASQRRRAGFVAGLIWLTLPYLFFFERMALADIEAGAAAVLLALALLPNVQTRRAAILGGIALGLALLFKVSALPFVGVPLLAFLLSRGQDWRVRLRRLALVYSIALIIVAPASLYSATRGGFFSIARGWVGSPQLSIVERTTLNAATLADTLLTVNGLWMLALIGVPLSALAGRRGLYVLGSVLGPLTVMIVFGTEVLDRHFGVVMPLLAVAAAAGWASVRLIPGRMITTLMLGGAVIVLAVLAAVGTWRVAYTDPAAFPMTAPMREQYISQHPSGYGLREAVQAFPQTVGAHPVIASMTADGCKRARYYLRPGTSLECTGMGVQGRDRIVSALQAEGTVYVLAEDQPVGIDPATVGGRWTPLAVYPRPGGVSRVTLWRVTR